MSEAPTEGGRGLEAELREALAPGLQLIERIGVGGMGSVYRARDPALRRDVAVKVLSPAMAVNAEARERFEREAAATATVRHAGVVAIHLVGRLPRSGTSYFVMEFIEGRSLEEAFPSGSQLPIPRARRIIGDLASALAAAHARGLIHRDVKPANVLLETATDRIVIVDFGISTLTPELPESPEQVRLTSEGTSLGTPAYMSPEQAADERVNAQSDVYNLGLVAFELLGGRHPFAGERGAMALRAAHINRVPAPITTLRPEVDETLSTLVDRCLAKSPHERPTATAVAAALLGDMRQTIEWPPPGLEALRTRAFAFREALWYLAVVSVVAVVAMALHPLPPKVDGDAGTMIPYEVTRLLALWQVAIGVSGLAWVGFVGTTAIRAAAVASSMLDGRLLAYPWRVLWRVALDNRADTMRLVNRIGSYGLLSEDSARHLERERLIATAARVLAALLLSVAPLALPWPLGRTGGAGERVVAPWVAGFVVALPLLLVFAALLQRVRERRLLGERMGRAALFVVPARPPAAVVRTWLSQQGLEERPPGRAVATEIVRHTVKIGGRVTAGAFAIVCVLWFVLSTVLIVEMIDQSTRSRIRAEEWLSLNGGSTRLEQAEAAFRVRARPPAVGSRVSEATLRGLLVPSGEVARTPQERGPRGTAVLRELESSALPEHWYLPLVDTVRPGSGVIDLRRLRELIGAVRADAEALLRRGAREAARADAITLVTVAERLGTSGPMRVPRHLLRESAVAVLSEIADRSADTVLLAEARGLRESLQTIEAEWNRRTLALTALHATVDREPSPAAFAMLRPPAAASELALAVVFGPCYGVREVVVGIDRRRRARFEELRTGTPDAGERRIIEGIAPLLAAFERPSDSTVAAVGMALPAAARLPGFVPLRQAWRRRALCDMLAAR